MIVASISAIVRRYVRACSTHDPRSERLKRAALVGEIMQFKSPAGICAIALAIAVASASYAGAASLPAANCGSHVAVFEPLELQTAGADWLSNLVMVFSLGPRGVYSEPIDLFNDGELYWVTTACMRFPFR